MERPAPPLRAIGVNLVVFFGVALTALPLLTHTLVDVKQVQAGVAEAVRPATGGIEADTALLPALGRTSDVTGQLATASQSINASLERARSSTRDAETNLRSVQSETSAIADSVAGIASSTSAAQRGVVEVAAGVRAAQGSTAGTAAALAGTSRAVGTLQDDLAAATARLRSLSRLIPSITQRARAITATLVEVDGHLVNINNNSLIQLTNLFQLSDLLVTSTASGR